MLTLAITLIAASVQVAAGSQEAVIETMANYEKIRALLAEDRIAGVPKLAERLARVAGDASDRSEGALKGHLKSVSQAAAVLKDAKDLESARKSFGEVSRNLVGALQAEPSLGSGRHIYKCPMVKGGYGIWIQTSKEISNPYMGKTMLRCGEPAE